MFSLFNYFHGLNFVLKFCEVLHFYHYLKKLYHCNFSKSYFWEKVSTSAANISSSGSAGASFCYAPAMDQTANKHFSIVKACLSSGNPGITQSKSWKTKLGRLIDNNSIRNTQSCFRTPIRSGERYTSGKTDVWWEWLWIRLCQIFMTALVPQLPCLGGRHFLTGGHQGCQFTRGFVQSKVYWTCWRESRSISPVPSMLSTCTHMQLVWHQSRHVKQFLKVIPVDGTENL